MGRAVRAVVVGCALTAMAACSPLPRQGAVGSTWVSSPNHDARRANFVILHHTSNGTADRALHTLTDPLRQVSAHYLVGRDGSVWQLVDESARAWHAGESRWGSLTDLNSASIGIELDNSGDEPFAEAQIQALLGLLEDVTVRHRIPRRNVLGHGDVAPWRKADPGALFPWDRLARHGFGLWCDSPPVMVPAGFDSRLAFQAVGYDLRDMGATLAAFRRHYLGRESSMDLEEGEMALLHCLAQQQAEVTGR